MRNPTRLPERCSRRPSHRFVPVLASAITGVTVLSRSRLRRRPHLCQARPGYRAMQRLWIHCEL